MNDDHFGTREEMIDRYRAEQKAHNACYERAHMLERQVAALRELLERFAKEWRFLIQIGQLDDHGELAQAEAALKGHAQGTPEP